MNIRWQNLNPLKLFSNPSPIFYHQLPADSRNGSPFTFESVKRYRWPSPRRAERYLPFKLSPNRMLLSAVTALVLVIILLVSAIKHHIVESRKHVVEPLPYFWQHYSRWVATVLPVAVHFQLSHRLTGYYNGVRTLVAPTEYHPENGFNQSLPLRKLSAKAVVKLSAEPPLEPVVFDPYPNYTSYEYLQQHHPVHSCYLDEAEKVLAPDVYAYPGIPQNMSAPFYGSYDLLGMDDQVCFDRYTRFGAYGYGYIPGQGGLGPGNQSEHHGAEKVFEKTGIIDYTDMDWGGAQNRCYTKNQARFAQTGSKIKLPRHAYVLRVWQNYYFNEHQMYTIRAMINELALKSGGEYDVHFLLHIKDTTLPIWASKEVYQQVVQENMPREFWSMTTLWSETITNNLYPAPFPASFQNVAEQSIHGVYRSAHFPLQWFSQMHPEYDFYWNWEMDLRFTGHYYEFNTRIGDWAKQQPRRGLWERNERFYIPEYYNTWENFSAVVDQETEASGRKPIWGPENQFPNSGMLDAPKYAEPPTAHDKEDNYEWGVGEEADFISFNPIFDPSKTNWVFRTDVTGYDLAKGLPPRRCAIITVARLSKRLLDIMHEETWRLKHTMFPEMWPPSVCLHHGLKAVYAPHPVYFDRDWNVDYMDHAFNHPREVWESPFGWGEHNMLGSSFYYNSGFSGLLWRRWLGQSEDNEGGKDFEEKGTGRMCLRSTLHHPVKHELGPMG